MAGWSCPKCTRTFARKGQRHACGEAEAADVLRGRAPELVATYRAIEAEARALGPIELVKRDRYVLFRGKRIFADVVIMTDAVRLAIHLPRRNAGAHFVKVVEGPRHVTHVVKLRGAAELDPLVPLLREAYDHSLQ